VAVAHASDGQNTLTVEQVARPDQAAVKAQVAVKAMVRVFKAWRISLADAARLVDVSERTWSRMKDDAWAGTLTSDQGTRASAIVGVYKGLHLYFGDDLADKWVKMPNRGPLFRGASPIDFMTSGGLLAIINVREYVDAIRGGL
jgi:uncharacterized protein (DUF2384 family)